ncbi:Protein MAIN-LIKE 2 [Linum perenne]
MTLNCRHSKKIVKSDPRFEPYLARIGLNKLTACLDFSPDPELITALVERWRPETSTFHLYHGEVTITLEDVHFLTGLSVDGAYILDFFGSCIFADRSGSYTHLFFLPLLEGMSAIGEYAWGVAALSWLYTELGRCAFRIESSPSRGHIGDIREWMTLVQAWELERFTSIVRRAHKSRVPWHELYNPFHSCHG